MFPGKRWIAGFSRNAASSFAGSVFAIAARIERAEPLLQLQWACERRRDGHLLVEREADQQRHRLLREEPVGLLVPGEVEAIETRR